MGISMNFIYVIDIPNYIIVKLNNSYKCKNMNYIISKYVYQFISSTNENLMYCSRTNSFLKLTSELYEYLKLCQQDSTLINDIDNGVIDLLKKHKIIVCENEDQDYLLKQQFLTDRMTYSNVVLGLVLAPTIACNFDCL